MIIDIGTGHRPNKLGGYSNQILEKAIAVATEYLTTNRPDKVISGLAIGWDTAFAIAAIRLKIPVIGAVPFKGQESKWFPESVKLYNRILEKCEEVVTVSEGGYSREKMLIRDYYMVDRCTRNVVALYNGTGGGTKHTLDYAEQQIKAGKQINVVNLWDKFKGDK